MSSRNFWLKLKKEKTSKTAESPLGDSAETGMLPILALAPMAGITDCAFRMICRKLGADVVYSEMVSADALYYDSKKTMELLKIGAKEHPVVVQLFGKRPELFKKAAMIAQKAGADGIDINFGCPAKKIVKDNGGVALMRDLELSKKIVQTVLDAVDIPVSVKIRAGINLKKTTKQDLSAQAENNKTTKDKITALDFMKNIIDLPIAAVMVHGRTYEQGFSGEVDYEMIKDVVDLMKISPNPSLVRRGNIVVLANGGIKNIEDAKNMIEKTGADGIGIAQGVLGKPWLFGDIKEHLRGKTSPQPPPQKRGSNAGEIKKIALEHAKLAYKIKGDYGIIEIRKHLLWYVKGLPNAKELREKLSQVENVDDIRKVLSKS